MFPAVDQQRISTIGRTHPFQILNGGLSKVAPGVAAWAAGLIFVTVIRHRPPAREAGWAEGATELTIRSAHGNLAAWKWGGGPRTVLLVHGWTGRGLQMGAFVQPLVGAGYRVVAYDGPSHGRSPGRQANLFKLTDGLVAVAEALGPLHGVIAHSLGTTQVLLAAHRGQLDPGRFVAVSPMADTRTMSRHFAAMTGFSESVVREMRRRFERRLDFRWDEIEPIRLAGAFRAESLVIHDRNDRDLPVDEGMALARALPRGHSLTTEGLGHRRILRDPRVVETAAAFLRGTAADSAVDIENLQRGAAPAA